MAPFKSMHVASLSEDIRKNLFKRAEIKKKHCEFRLAQFSSPLISAKVSDMEVKDSSDLVAWHYTTGKCFLAIARSVFLLPTKAKFSDGEIPILMFSKKKDWEPIFRKAVNNESNQRDSIAKNETALVGGGLFRFGYPVERLMPSKQLLKLANVPHRIIKCLENIGRSLGATPSDWLGTFDAIPIEQLIIEFSDGEQWVRIQNRMHSTSSISVAIVREVS